MVIVQVVSCARFDFVSAVHNGRLISWPLFSWDFCSNCGSKPRHGGHWYIPWESTGYPKVIIAASWIFLFFCSLDDFPGYLFSNGGQCVQSFLYFCFPPSARILLISHEGFFFSFFLKGKLYPSTAKWEGSTPKQNRSSFSVFKLCL